MINPTKTVKESVGVTQPVILIGVDRQEAPEFHHVVLVREDVLGVQVSETHLHGGSVSVQMMNGTLKVFVKDKG